MKLAPILCLAGPTASGKSAYSLLLAQNWPVEIIVMDSATIYRGMDIGTAKPGRDEQAAVAHHLLDIRDPAYSYSAAEFALDAATLINDIQARGHLPVLCGGTMLYYKALKEGLSDLPRANPGLRAALEQQAQDQGWPAMHALLARFDPATAKRLAPRDSQRIQRALEVYYSSGTPMSALLRAQPRLKTNLRYITFSLEPAERAWLHARIEQRYYQMLEQGLLHEVQALHARKDLHPGLPSVRCVGYRQLWDYLDGKISQEHAIEQAIAATRQLAKRQLTWLRSEPDRHIIDCQAASASEQVLALARQYWPS